MSDPGVKSLPSCLTFYETSPSVETYHDVIYYPEHRCLFSKDGLRIAASCRPHKVVVDGIPDAITPPQNLDCVSQRLIYAGTVIWHYGHFLTESISRMWYALKDETLPILYTEATRELIAGPATSSAVIHRAEEPKYSIRERASDRPGGSSKSPEAADAGNFVDDFLDFAPFDRNRLTSFENPVYLEEIVIPHPSFTLNKECFSEHRTLPGGVAEKALQRIPDETSQPLYLSRTRLGKDNSLREIENEDILEEILREKNCLIVYPEQLTLKEQIRLINRHRVVVGVCGSALHSILFDLTENTHLVCINDYDRVDDNFLLVDAVLGVTSTYLPALSPEEDSSTVRWKQKRSININDVLAGLQELNLF